MTIAQYYNQARRRMEIPLSSGETGNYISYCSLENATLAVFDSIPPVTDDILYRYIPGVGWKFVQYWEGYGWYGEMSDFTSIEAGIGYKYKRMSPAATWYYDCVFFPSVTQSQLCRKVGAKGVQQ